MDKCREEFEEYFKEHHADSFYSVDVALEMRGDDYIDFLASDLWAIWQHQQAKVEELQKQNAWLSDIAERENKRANKLKEEHISTTILLGKVEQQKVELQKKLSEYIFVAETIDEMYVKEVQKSDELQKRMDKALELMQKPVIVGEPTNYVCARFKELERALKGEGL